VSLFWSLFRRIAFRIDAETAHRFIVRVLQLIGRIGSGAPLIRWLSGASKASNGEAQVLGMTFQNRVGLAAGFDKNCELLGALPALGFGFAEIGTVTPRPQPGNELPRLFRDSSQRALFNRMGFNNLGAEIVAARLKEVKPTLPVGFRVGVNLGKNKNTPNEQASGDFAHAARPFRDLADYLVVNVSSPNTPGLRALQSIELLTPILTAVQDEISGWTRKTPLLLKIAPELDDGELQSLVPAVEKLGISGWVVTNTLAGEWASGGVSVSGGWSGGPLSSLAKSRLRTLRSLTRLPVISVGGILEGADAIERIQMGADLIQVYTGWVYGGPRFPANLARKIAGNTKSRK
jgi:dihydroorotate dehydrogenase